MMSIIFKSTAAILAAAGLAVSAGEDALSGPAYSDSLAELTEESFASHAAVVFQRTDRNQDGYLQVDEFAAFSIVSAELARLNGFVVIEDENGPATLEIAGYSPSALSRSEHIRIDAVARNTFFLHAGDDGVMSEDEFTDAQRASFDAADFNRNGVLRRGELEAFAYRQAHMSVGV